MRRCWFGEKSLPPGPTGWPVVGSLYSLGPRNIPACRRFAALAAKYGALMFLRMGSRPTVVISDSTTAKEFFKSQDNNFSSRPRLATGKHFGYDYSSVVFSSGEKFTEMRLIYSAELLSSTNVKKLAPVRMEEIRFLMADVLRRSESERLGDRPHATEGLINITSMVFKANLNLMGRIIFSQSLFGDSGTVNATPKEVENFKFFVKSATRLVGLFNVGDYIPALRWLDLQGVEGDLQRLKPHQEGLLLPIIHQYRKMHHSAEGFSKQEDRRVDFIAALVAKYSTLSDENIMAVAIDLIVGGSDSASTAVEWGMTELLRHPHYLQEVQAELDAVVGRDRLVELSDCDKLPFLDCVVRETLRLHPPSPLAIPHYSSQECTLGGCRIPAKTTAYVNIHAIHRDPKVYTNPNEFQPKRFKTLPSMQVMAQNCESIPFSAGRRACPGQKFAFPTVMLMLGNLLQCFSWSPPPGIRGEDIDVDEAPGVVCSRLKPLVASATPRVEKSVILDHK